MTHIFAWFIDYVYSMGDVYSLSLVVVALGAHDRIGDRFGGDRSRWTPPVISPRWFPPVISPPGDLPRSFPPGNFLPGDPPVHVTCREGLVGLVLGLV